MLKFYIAKIITVNIWWICNISPSAIIYKSVQLKIITHVSHGPHSATDLFSIRHFNGQPQVWDPDMTCRNKYKMQNAFIVAFHSLTKCNSLTVKWKKKCDRYN